MPEKYYRDAIVLGAIESSYGVDAEPDAYDAILCGDVQHDPEWAKRERNYIRSSISPIGFGVGMRRQNLKLTTELKGRVGVFEDFPQRLSVLYAMCSYNERVVKIVPVSSITNIAVGDTFSIASPAFTGTVHRIVDGTVDYVYLTSTNFTNLTAGASFTTTSGGSGTVSASPAIASRRLFYPVSRRTIQRSSTIYYYLDGIKHALVGCRATGTMNFNLDGYASFTAQIKGLYVAPKDASNPADPDIEKHQPPACENLGLTIGSYAPVGLEELSVDLGAALAETPDMQSSAGVGSIYIAKRETKISMTFAMDSLANFNPYADAIAGRKREIQWNLGATAGNRLAFWAPEAQLDSVQKMERDGRALYQITYLCTGEDTDFYWYCF